MVKKKLKFLSQFGLIRPLLFKGSHCPLHQEVQSQSGDRRDFGGSQPDQADGAQELERGASLSGPVQGVQQQHTHRRHQEHRKRFLIRGHFDRSLCHKICFGFL